MSFSSDIRRHADKYKKRIRATYRNSVQELGERSNQSRFKGGNTPIDTGFMRASQAYELDQMPRGPTKNESGKKYSEGERIGKGPVEVLGMWQPGDTVFIGWSASYSRFMNARFGFATLAAQKWESIVNKNAQKAKARGL